MGLKKFRGLIQDKDKYVNVSVVCNEFRNREQSIDWFNVLIDNENDIEDELYDIQKNLDINSLSDLHKIEDASSAINDLKDSLY